MEGGGVRDGGLGGWICVQDGGWKTYLVPFHLSCTSTLP